VADSSALRPSTRLPSFPALGSSLGVSKPDCVSDVLKAMKRDEGSEPDDPGDMSVKLLSPSTQMLGDDIEKFAKQDENQGLTLLCPPNENI